MLFRIRAGDFDGTTVLPSTALVTQVPNAAHYEITDSEGASLSAVGIIPLSRLTDVVGSSMMRFAMFYHGGGVSEARASAAYYADPTIHTLTRERVWDPTVTGTSEGFACLNAGWSLVLSTNTTVGQIMMFEVLPIREDSALALAVDSDQFGAETAGAQLVAGSFTDVQTAAYTAGAGQVVLYDTSAGAFTVTLPAAPAANDVIGFVDAGNSAVNALTIDGDGNNVQSQSAGTFAATQTYTVASGNIYYRFDGTQWRIVGVRD